MLNFGRVCLTGFQLPPSQEWDSRPACGNRNLRPKAAWQLSRDDGDHILQCWTWCVFGEVTFYRNRLWRWVVYKTTSSKIKVIYVIWHVYVQTILAEKPILLGVRNMLGILKEHESSLPKKCSFTFLWWAILVYWNRKKISKTHTHTQIATLELFFTVFPSYLTEVCHTKTCGKVSLNVGATFLEDVSKWKNCGFHQLHPPKTNMTMEHHHFW